MAGARVPLLPEAPARMDGVDPFKFVKGCREPWAEFIEDPSLARKWCIGLLAGDAAERDGGPTVRSRIAMHESAHWVTLRILGFHAGGLRLSTIGETTYGLCSADTAPCPDEAPSVSPGAFKLKKGSDIWRVCRIVWFFGWATGWKQIRAVLRGLQAEARALYRRNWEVATLLGFKLLERESMTASEARHEWYSICAYKAMADFETGLTRLAVA
jgi:hypothetical protein